MESREESIESLEEVFHTIQSVTGEENLDMLVSRFIQGQFHTHKHIGSTSITEPHTVTK